MEAGEPLGQLTGLRVPQPGQVPDLQLVGRLGSADAIEDAYVYYRIHEPGEDDNIFERWFRPAIGPAMPVRFLGVFERVNGRQPFQTRFIVDHAETVSPRNIERIMALGGGSAIDAAKGMAVAMPFKTGTGDGT